MQKTEAYYKDLLSRFIDNILPTSQVEELFDFIQQYPEVYSRLLNEEVIREKLRMQAMDTEVPEVVSNRMRERLLIAIHRSPRVEETLTLENGGVGQEPKNQPLFFLKFYWKRYAAVAAALILLAGSGGYLWFRQQEQKAGVVSGKMRQDVLPGKQGAILTLADGSHIVLDSLGNGVVTTQGNQQIILANGRILYKGIDGMTPEKALYNTMSTPKGRQYQLVLSDGSKVWLNAASSITYPTAFTGKERTVTITGEAYFEVAHLPSSGRSPLPFVVGVNGMKVQVLGTHFNINAYGDESAIKTTLLEGSVKVSRGNSTLFIKPGQQAVFSNSLSGDGGIISDADVDQIMAWKEGLFNFEGADLKTVLRQLGRWYDVDVVFEGNIPQRKFGGEMPMNLNLSQALRLLGKMEVKYRIEGKKLVVTP